MNDWRNPCEHGRYDAHDFDNHWQGISDCPGGSPVTAADLEGETVWWCGVLREAKPEMYDHCHPDFVPDPRYGVFDEKHDGCGWRLLIPIPDPQPERPLPQWTLTEEGWVWDDSIPDPQPATEWGPDHPSYDEMGQ